MGLKKIFCNYSGVQAEDYPRTIPNAFGTRRKGFKKKEEIIDQDAESATETELRRNPAVYAFSATLLHQTTVAFRFGVPKPSKIVISWPA